MTITETQIRALRGVAQRNQDIVLYVVCSIALDEREELADDYSGGGHEREELREIARWLDADQGDAWRECERVIAATA